MSKEKTENRITRKTAQFRSRVDLREAFRKNMTPTEDDFHSLIDSMANFADDPVRFHPQGGMIVCEGENRELIEFVGSEGNEEVKWAITAQNQYGVEGLNFIEAVEREESAPPVMESRIFIQKETHEQAACLGINNASPQYTLDSYGTTGLYSQVGTYLRGKVPANGVWQDILKSFRRDDQVKIFGYEVTAYTVNSQKRGRHAVTRAICMGAKPSRRGWLARFFFGNSTQGITVTQGAYGGRRNRIELQWGGTTDQPMLQIRTRRGTAGMEIEFKVTSLLPHTFTDK